MSLYDFTDKVSAALAVSDFISYVRKESFHILVKTDDDSRFIIKIQNAPKEKKRREKPNDG